MAIEIESEKLNQFLEQERGKVISYLRNKFSDYKDEDLEDIYQDSSIALYNNIKEGKLKELTASLSSYFTKICINQAINYSRNKGIEIPMTSFGEDGKEDWKDDDIQEDKVNDLFDDLADDDESLNQEALEKRIRDIVAGLSGKCEELLWGVYRDGFNMDALAARLGFSNANSAKTQKNKCMNAFRDKFNLYEE